MTAAVNRRDISDRDDIAAMVTDFYGRAFRDDLLGPIFVDIAKMDLAAHLPVMCDFWETALFRAGRYHRNALRPHLDLHAKVALSPAHFQRWLTLWTSTIDERHAGEKAQLAKDQAVRIAASISRRLSGQAAGQLIIGPAPTGRGAPREIQEWSSHGHDRIPGTRPDGKADGPADPRRGTRSNRVEPNQRAVAAAGGRRRTARPDPG